MARFARTEAASFKMLRLGGALAAVLSLQPAPLHGASHTLYHGFTCDTDDPLLMNNSLSVGGNVFSAVAFPMRTHAPDNSSAAARCPPGSHGIGGSRFVLDPRCYTTPAEAKAQLNAFPKGARALTLESGLGMYYLVDPNSSATRWPDHSPRYYMDTLPGPAGVQGPWADSYVPEMVARFSAWFRELKRLGGEVDLVMSDFEMGYHTSSYNWAHQPTADGSNPTEALVVDPRWPALRARLNTAGAPYGVDFNESSVAAMADWTSQGTVWGYRMLVWNMVVKNAYLPRAIIILSLCVPHTRTNTHSRASDHTTGICVRFYCAPRR